MKLREHTWMRWRHTWLIVLLAILLLLAGGVSYYVVLNRQYYARFQTIRYVGSALVSYMHTHDRLPMGWDELIVAGHFRREGESICLSDAHPYVEEGRCDAGTPVPCAEAVRFRASVDGKLVPFILEVDDGFGARYGPIEGYWKGIEAARTKVNAHQDR
jgi:hypothetical protein